MSNAPEQDPGIPRGLSKRRAAIAPHCRQTVIKRAYSDVYLQPSNAEGARMDMNVNETADGVTHVALGGRFDIEGAQQVDGPITELAKRAKILVIDLSKVSFIASLGVRTLMTSAKTIIGRGAYIAVAGANEGVEKVLRLTGFDELVGLYPDYAAAATSLTARSKEFEGRKS